MKYIPDDVGITFECKVDGEGNDKIVTKSVVTCYFTVYRGEKPVLNVDFDESDSDEEEEEKKNGAGKKITEEEKKKKKREKGKKERKKEGKMSKKGKKKRRKVKLNVMSTRHFSRKKGRSVGGWLLGTQRNIPWLAFIK